MRERALRLLSEKLDEAEADRMRRLRQGSVKTIEDYREQVGFLQALDLIRGECAVIEKKFHGDDERDGL